MKKKRGSSKERTELSEACFRNYGASLADDESVNNITRDHWGLLEACGFVIDGVSTFTIRDLVKLRNEFWNSHKTRRSAAAAVFQDTLKQGVELQRIFYRNTVESDGRDKDSGALWVGATKVLTALTGANAPERVENITTGSEADDIVSLAEVFNARQVALMSVPEDESDAEADDRGGAVHVPDSGDNEDGGDETDRGGDTDSNQR